jgi:HD-GYP domain-containing protein (c-di-GMP phosphodiesterase class II)
VAHDPNQSIPGVPRSGAVAADALAFYDSISTRHRNLLAQPSQASDFAAEMTTVAEDLRQLLERDLDVALFQTLHRDPSNDAAVHSFGVAMICGAVGRRMGAAESEVLQLLAAALTMNIAMIDLQRQLWSQSTPLTQSQRDQIQTHPERGRVLLETLGVRDADWLRAVAEHHETPDGNGYPRGVRTPSALANIIRNIDVYCAMLGARSYRVPMLANQAARRLYMLAESSKDPVPTMIIDAVGIFPPGNYVRLANGELAIVTHRGSQAHTPRVLSLRNGFGQAFAQPQRRDTAQAEFSVSELLPPENVESEVDVRALFSAPA